MGDAPSAQEQLLVVFPFPEPTPLIQSLRQEFPGINVVYYRVQGPIGVTLNKESDIPKDVLAATTMMCTLHYYPPLEAVPRLKLAHSITAGLDHILKDPIVTDTDIPITTVSGIHGPPISEWVIMNWLVASRIYDKTAAWQRDHIWQDDKSLIQMMQDHVDMRVGILGYGSIGRQVARVAVAMGMKVLAYTNSPRPTPESRRDKGYIVPGTGDPDGSLPIAWHSGASKAALHEFLSQDLDYILIAVPLTPETTGLLGAEEFQILSKSCTRVGRRPFLTNIARGKVIDQDALINSLKSGELGGAALDVADPEPLPADHPLWDAPNVHITPHMSALGVEYLGRAFDVLKENLRRMQRGEDLVNVYKRRRGY